MSDKPGRVLQILAYVDWVRRAEREDYRRGLTTVMPPPSFNEPAWLRALRASKRRRPDD